MNATCAPPACSIAVRQMDASLQLLEAGRLALRVERDDLAVEDERLPCACAPTCSSAAAISGNCRVFSLPSRDHRRTRPFGAISDDRADAVVLRFVDELRDRRAARRRATRASGASIGVSLQPISSGVELSTPRGELPGLVHAARVRFFAGAFLLARAFDGRDLRARLVEAAAQALHQIDDLALARRLRTPRA